MTDCAVLRGVAPLGAASKSAAAAAQAVVAAEGGHRCSPRRRGNPMVLIELVKVIAANPGASRRWAAEPLPLTDRLSAVLGLP